MEASRQVPLQAIIRPGIDLDRNQEVVDLALFDEDGNNFFLPGEFDPETLPAFPVGEPVVTNDFALDTFRRVSTEKSGLVIVSVEQPRAAGAALNGQLAVRIGPTNVYADSILLYHIGSNLGTDASNAITWRFNTQIFLPVGWWWMTEMVTNIGVNSRKCVEQTLG